MSIHCVPSSLGNDVRCAVCGQAFLIFADRIAQKHREPTRGVVQSALRLHHSRFDDHHAHPVEGFSVVLAPTDFLAAS